VCVYGCRRVDKALLSQLKESRIITEEEAVMDFYTTAAALTAQGNAVLARQESIGLDTVSDLVDQLDSALDFSVRISFAGFCCWILTTFTTVQASPDYSDCTSDAYSQLNILSKTLGNQESEALNSWDSVKKCLGLCATLRGISSSKFDDALSSAVQTRIVDYGLYQQAVELKAKAAALEVDATERLKNCTKAVADFSQLEALLSESKSAPLSDSLIEAIQMRYSVAKLVVQCHRLLQLDTSDNNSGFSWEEPPNEERINEIRRLLSMLNKYTNPNAPTSPHSPNIINSISVGETEKAMIDDIEGEFRLFCWRQEALYLVLSPRQHQTTVELAVAQQLLQTGAQLGDLARASPQWTPLEKAVEDTERVVKTAELLIDSFTHAVTATNGVIRDWVQANTKYSLAAAAESKCTEEGSLEVIGTNGSGSHELTIDATFVQQYLVGEDFRTCLQVALSEFHSSADGLPDNISNVFEEAKTILFKQHSTFEKLAEVLSMVKAVEAGWTVCERSFELGSAKLSSESDGSGQLCEFSEVTSSANSLQQLCSETNSGWHLMSLLSVYLLNLHLAASNWYERAQLLVPSGRSTRRTMKAEDGKHTARLTDIEALLAQPICRIVSLPMYDKIADMAGKCRELQSKCLKFILNNNSKGRGNVHEHDYQAGIFDDIIKVGELTVEAEQIPVETVESKLLSWSMSVLMWMQGAPPLGADAKAFSLTLSSAKQKLREGEGCWKALPTMVKEYFVEKNLLQEKTAVDSRVQLAPPVTDPLAGTSASALVPTTLFHFTSSANLQMQHFSELLNYLRSKITETEEYQIHVRTCVANHVPLEKLLPLYTKTAELLVSPELEIRKTLENSITKLRAMMIGVHHTRAGGSTSIGSYAHTADMTSDKKRKPEDMVVAAGAAAAARGKAPVMVAKRVKRVIKCANSVCSNEVAVPFQYCNDACAAQDVPRTYRALLDYRVALLCRNTGSISGTAGDKTSSVNDASDGDQREQQLDAIILTDVSLFRSARIDGHSSLDDIAESLKKSGYMISTGEIGNSDSAVTTPQAENGSLAQLLKASEDTLGNRRSDVSAHHFQGMATIVHVLPRSASALLRKEGAADEAAVNPSAGSPRGSVPAGNTGGEGPDLRKIVRSNFEEIIATALARLRMPSALAHAAVLALEIEFEMFNKYCTLAKDGGSNVKPEFNKKDYRKHQLMLQRNLKQQHNDSLIARLANMELSIDALLNMSSEQFADESTQLLRAQRNQMASQESQRKSLQQQMEDRFRETLHGHETWRTKDGDSTVSSASAGASDVNKLINSLTSTGSTTADRAEAGTPRLFSSSADPMDVVDGENNQQDELAVSPGSPKAHDRDKRKKSVNVDAMGRFSTDRPKSHKNPEKQSMVEESINPLSMHPSQLKEKQEKQQEEENKHKIPNIVELLKANKSASDLVVSPSASGDASPMSPLSTAAVNSNLNRGSSSSAAASGPFLLVSNLGQKVFSVCRPGAAPIECVGVLYDRRIQGLVKNTINIDGRTRIAELERFLNEVVSYGRKIVITFQFYISRSSGDSRSSYRKLCDEYARDSRAGLSNVSDVTQVYLVPPAMKHHLSILSNVDVDDGGRDKFFGIVVSKEVGPSNYVYGEVENTDAHRPPSPLDFRGATASTVPAFTSSIQAPVYHAPVPAPVLAAPKLAPTMSARPAPSSSTPAHSSNIVSPVPSPSSSATPPVVNSVQYEKMKKVAMFCAQNGVQSIHAIKEKPEAEAQMPFLFEGRPGHQEFLAILKQILYPQGSSSAKR
jgi:hypothetical protein